MIYDRIEMMSCSDTLNVLHAYLVMIPADRLPRYPSRIYCRVCGLSHSHLPGCSNEGVFGGQVAPPARIRRDEAA